MDDGSASPAESLEMLALSRAQGVEILLATPHFYAATESLEQFLERRGRAVAELLKVYDADLHPRVCLGAEVEFFSGISRSHLNDRLTVEGTRLLLLEMPFDRWSDAQIEEVVFLGEQMGIIPLIAHVERYERFQKRGVIEYMIEHGVLFQSNAEFFLDTKTAKRAKKKLMRGEIAVLGSDCHNMSTRMPNLAQAYEQIVQDGGEQILFQMQDFGNMLLADAVSFEKKY